MSHISTYASHIKIGSEEWLKKAIGMMADQFNGIKFEQQSENLIMVRYRPIEGYQSRGNMRFVKNAHGQWEMQYDTWQCAGQVEKVRDAFYSAYQQVAAMQFCSRFGYQMNVQKTGNQVVVIGRKL